MPTAQTTASKQPFSRYSPYCPLSLCAFGQPHINTDIEHLCCCPFRSGWCPCHPQDLLTFRFAHQIPPKSLENLACGAVFAGAHCHALIHRVGRPQMFKPMTGKKSVLKKQEYNFSWCGGFRVSVTPVPSHCAPRTCPPFLWICNSQFMIRETRRRTEKQQPDSTLRQGGEGSHRANKPSCRREKR